MLLHKQANQVKLKTTAGEIQVLPQTECFDLCF